MAQVPVHATVTSAVGKMMTAHVVPVALMKSVVHIAAVPVLEVDQKAVPQDLVREEANVPTTGKSAHVALAVQVKSAVLTAAVLKAAQQDQAQE